MSIPAGIILLVILLLVVPSLFAQPAYDFLYTHCPTYDCYNNFVIGGDGRIKAADTPTSINSNDSQTRTELYYHDTHQNSSRRIEFAEASSYHLNPSTLSRDGYSLSSGGASDSGFLFWGYSDDYTWHLKKGSLQKSKSLNLGLNGYDSSSIKLVGWVEK